MTELLNIDLPHVRGWGKIDPKRQHSIDNNLKYYQGNPCARGHSGKRLAKDGQCVDCRSLNRKNERNNPNKRRRERDWELKKNFGISLDDYNCNVGIGFLKHNPELLRNAALYCEETK